MILIKLFYIKIHICLAFLTFFLDFRLKYADIHNYHFYYWYLSTRFKDRATKKNLSRPQVSHVYSHMEGVLYNQQVDIDNDHWRNFGTPA